LAIVGGVAWGLAEAQFASMDVFTFAPLGIPNWTLQHSLFLASVAAGYTISMGAQAPVRRFLPWLFAGIALPFVARSTPWAMAGAPLAGLAVGGAAAWRVLRAASAGGVVLTALLLGQVTALLLGHALAYTFGYSGTALIAGLLFFLTSVGAILARPDRTVAAS
jgi:hypothetical protein